MKVEMTKRLTLTALAVLLAFGFVACGGDGPVDPTPIATPAPPTQAVVTFNVDPTPLVANHAGNDWYRFKVNLAFAESAGIGFTVNTLRLTVSDPATGTVYMEDAYSWSKHVNARGREVLQYTSPLYRDAAGGRISLDCDFVADITDDRGNSITLSNRAEVSHRGGPRVEIPQ